MRDVHEALASLRAANPQLDRPRAPAVPRRQRLAKVLVANRGEIAKRFFFALKEEGIPSVAIVTDPDRQQSWYEFADEVVYIGAPMNYTSVPVVLAAMLLSGANAVYPGYGFLSEDHRFVAALGRLGEAEGRELIFMGPPAEVMRRVGSKVAARDLARQHGVPLLDGTGRLPDLDTAKAEAARIGYPVMVKLSAGGGGKGMTAVHTDAHLTAAWQSARRLGGAQYDDDSIYLERYVERPVHVEVQLFNGTAVGIRQCAVQRRNQKVIEEAGDFFLEDRAVLRLLAAGEAMAEASGYADGGGAGTVEFLLDQATGAFGFLEINARLQVEYPVTDQSLRIDLVKWQILFFDGREQEIPYEHVLGLRFAEKDHTIECRIYAEDPWQQHAPSPGVIQDLDLPTFNGIRCDFGFKKGDTILPHYDPMIGKLIARGRTRRECLLRLERALGELYVRGITTNVDQLIKIVRHPEFRSGAYTNTLLQDAAELGSPEAGDERPIDAAVFCALAELARATDEALEESLASGDLERILTAGRLNVVPAFSAEVHGRRLAIDLLQLGLAQYAAFVNDTYYGRMVISRRAGGSADVLIVFRGRSHPVRIDRRPSFHVLRVMEADGIHYYRVRLQSRATGRTVDPPGTVRAPFQGSFVTFATDRSGAPLRVGSHVEPADPLLVIEAMKMETALTAPVGGTITYLVEDGDLSRLVRGTTSQGLVIGRPLAEGEILAIVEDPSQASAPPVTVDVVDVPGEPDEILGGLRDPTLLDGGLAAAARRNPRRAFPRILDLVRASLLGYVHDDDVQGRLERGLEDLARDPSALEGGEEVLAQILEDYASLKQIYSPALGANQTWFSEMSRLVAEWDNETYAPPPFFRAVLGGLLAGYGIAWSGGKRTDDMRLALFHVLRGHSKIHDARPLVLALLELCRARRMATPAVLAAARRLVQQEQYERDDALTLLGRSYLARAAGGERPLEIRIATESFREPTVAGSPAGLATEDGGTFRARALAALERPTTGLVATELPDWVRREVDDHVGRWSARWRVEPLPSPAPSVVVYRLRPPGGGAHSYASLAWIDDVPRPLADDRGGDLHAPDLERAATEALRALAAWDAIAPGEGNILAVLACARPLSLDVAGRDAGALRGEWLREVAERVWSRAPHVQVPWFLFELDVERGPHVERKVLHADLRHGRVILDILDERDRTTPVWNGVVDERDQRLFDRKKWPLELWVREAFDPDTARELTVDSIDGRPGEGPRPAVGARIYEGLMQGRPAVFFLKDSRVAGGATGDLEGRKYVAACYYAYLADRPLYLWNDGAGANIRQGLVSLNRAAEGFMMNALVAGRVPYERFVRTVRSHDDPVVRALANELDEAFGLPDAAAGREGPRSFVLIAVGVGSSTGLDVYGSSQAAIQVMLDAEESYRTLTGAGVIRAVTGEDLTNYEIGGARVMGPWTGTVDVVARDRVELLARLRVLHALFAPHAAGPVTGGGAGAAAAGLVDRAAGAILTEAAIVGHVDDGLFLPFKDEYVEAGALIGGFARLGGKHVLIMGPRTDGGLRSFASVVKAKELLQIANKTGSPKIVVLGGAWYRGGVEGEDEMALRARMDFVRLLFAPGTPRVSIITRPAGLLLVTLASHADAVIYVRRPDDSEADRRLASRTATFQVGSLRAAFDVASRVLSLVQPEVQPLAFAPPVRAPSVPVDTSRPFDMVGDVIDALVDEGTFLEYHREGREGGASTLVTGLATLEGRAVGVIADQPLAGGAPDAPGTEKFRVFVEYLARHAIPLLMLSNAPGFVPGTKQERLRIQQIGGESLDVNVLSRMPVVSVVLNQNFGGRQIHAFSRFLRPGIAYIALDRALLAVMGGAAAFDLFHGARYQELIAKGRRKEADRVRNDFLEAFIAKSRATGDASDTGVLDWVVPEVADLRAHIVRALQLAGERARESFGPARDG